MNSLEFINQNIFECKNYIEHLENKIIEDKKYPSLVKDHKERIEEIKPILNHLQQIKSELEAWEVVQGTIVEGQDGDGRYCYIETVYFTGEKGEKVMKGLYNDETR